MTIEPDYHLHRPTPRSPITNDTPQFTVDFYQSGPEGNPTVAYTDEHNTRVRLPADWNHADPHSPITIDTAHGPWGITTTPPDLTPDTYLALIHHRITAAATWLHRPLTFHPSNPGTPDCR